MIARLDKALTGMVRAEHGDDPHNGSDDEEDDDLPGLYFPLDYVLMTWFEKKERGILPEPGGLNDQDWRLVYYDWPLVTARYNKLDRQLYPPKEEQIALPESGQARPAMDIFKEPE